MDAGDNGEDQKLSQTLSELGGRRIQRSVWLIRVKERDAKRVISGLRPYVESDLLWVSEVNSNYGYNRALTGTNSWLIENGVWRMCKTPMVFAKCNGQRHFGARFQEPTKHNANEGVLRRFRKFQRSALRPSLARPLARLSETRRPKCREEQSSHSLNATPVRYRSR